MVEAPTPKEVMAYECLKVALFEKYDINEGDDREKFCKARPENLDSPGQFIFKIQGLFYEVGEIGKSEASLQCVVDLIVREQFTNSCSNDLSIWIKQSDTKTLDITVGG